MKSFLAIVLFVYTLAPGSVEASTLAAGLYRSVSGSFIYVGPEHFLPHPATNQFFEPESQRFGDIKQASELSAQRTIEEERRIVTSPLGKLGVSLYYADAKQRAAVILIHGNDSETREMGFLIPYFVLSGVDVISYDQRGTGLSEGSWMANGPAQRAQDVDAIFDAFAADGKVDPKRIGVWGFSNGGWTAPIVAAQRPIAFMLLKSAPAESLEENLLFEVRQSMRHRSQAKTAEALIAWHALLDNLSGTATWEKAGRLYTSAQKQPWFDDSLLPPGLEFPLRSDVAQAFRNFVFYDPAPVLRRVTTPTLAMYGADDRKVDVHHDSKILRASFHAAGMTDFMMHIYPDAMHTLLVTSNGSDSVEPERYAAGYPSVMIEWLQKRRLL